MSVLLSVRDIAKSYAHRHLFAGLSLDLRAGERVGLIGPNGAGKSTLLRILAGTEVPDAGDRAAVRGARIGFITQDDAFPPGVTAHQVVVAALTDEHLEDYEQETRATVALAQAGFADFEVRADTLSGGWRKRLSVARELARRPDILLLDEPTNHLDLVGVEWLAETLRAAPFGYLAATHDRAFLRVIADEIVEVNRVFPGGAFRAAGGYDSFDDKREQFLDAQERQREAVANRVRRETDWLGRKESAQRRKSKTRIADAAARRAELADLTDRTANRSPAGIDFAGTGRQTRKLLAGAGLTKALGGRTLFQNVDVTLAPGTRLGLVGANGSGKSTLLHLLAGRLDPDAGTVTRADGLRLEVFEQGRSSLAPNLPLRKALSPNAETVVFAGQPIHVAGWARRFLFHPEQLDLMVGALSGGEQARIRIAQMMLRPADVLLLDEPTNDLDIPSLEVLEDSLAEFPGAVVLVTHDRELMDRLCTEVIGLDGTGRAAPYATVGQWLAAMRAAAPAAEPERKTAPRERVPSKAKKLSWKEQQEFDGMEAAILAAEDAVSANAAAVEAASTAGHAVLTEACRQLETSQAAVERLYARWQELEAKRTAAEG